MCLWANTAPRRLSLLSRTGQVEVWTHPVGRRWERTVIDLLKKGQSFGDQAILNGELRSECVTAASNVSMLTVGGWERGRRAARSLLRAAARKGMSPSLPIV